MTSDKHPQTISGIHHITAIASSASENLRFYTDVLGLRLVKKTVNFDDPARYEERRAEIESKLPALAN